MKISTIIRSITPRNSFMKSITLLVGGSLTAQILLVAASPILTRLYSPSDFGVLGVYTSVLAVTILISSLRFDIAIPLPEDDEEAANLVALSLVILIIISLLITICALIFRRNISEIFELPLLGDYILLFPLGTLIGGAYNILSRWSVRKKKFKLIASTNIIKSVFLLIIHLSCFKFGALSLLLGHTISHGVGITRLARPDFDAVYWSKIYVVASRYRRFPIFSAPAGLLRTLGAELPSLVLAAAFSPAAAGLYALTRRVCGLPAGIVGGAVSQVFISSAAGAYRDGTLGPLVKNFHEKMAHIGMPIMLLLMVLGPKMFTIVFGQEWTQAGQFASWMAPGIYLGFVTSPISSVTAVMDLQKQGLIFHFLLLLARIIALCVGVWLGDVLSTVVILAIVNAVWRLVFLMWLFLVAGNSLPEFLVDNLLAFLLAAGCVAPVYVAINISDGLWIYGFVMTLLMISAVYWRSLKQAY